MLRAKPDKLQLNNPVDLLRKRCDHEESRTSERFKKALRGKVTLNQN